VTAIQHVGYEQKWLTNMNIIARIRNNPDRLKFICIQLLCIGEKYFFRKKKMAEWHTLRTLR
jgi:hypothetical protein